MFAKLTTSLFASRKRAAVTVIFWFVLVGLLSSFAPTLGSVENNAGANLPPAASDSMRAKRLTQAAFPTQAAVPAVIAVRGKGGDAHSAAQAVERIGAALSGPARPPGVLGFVSSATVPRSSSGLVSADGGTQLILVPIAGNPSDDSFIDAVTALRKVSAAAAGDATVAVTGPAGIAADAIKVFSGADLTLLFATILLVLVLLLAIYRSPLSALVPLLAVFLAMRVTQGTGALMAQADWFDISAQTASIMTVLLFGVGTDYALIITARYREELATEPDRFKAMQSAMRWVGETIMSSASTVVLSMFALLVAVSPALRDFGPYLALSVAIMALVAFTFIPALILLLGRAIFWPARKPVAVGGRGWQRLATIVTTSPVKVIGASVLLLAILSAGLLHYEQSFDMVSGFRVATQSQQGQEIVREGFGPGAVAPSNVLVHSSRDLRGSSALGTVTRAASELEGVASVDPVAQVSADGHTALFKVTLDHDPYSSAALGSMVPLRDAVERSAKEAGLTGASVLIGGETAQTADIRSALDRDTSRIVPLVLLIVAGILALLLRSLLAPVYLVGTLLLSFLATLGATTFFTLTVLGDEGIGNRVAVYIFVFLVALGVDYNIFIMSRFKQELRNSPPLAAIRTAVTQTGGVVSSAGLILAATFSVLMTQPIRELFQFGFAMAFGILLDTFVVRPLLVPAIVTLLGEKALWPSKPATPDPGSRDHVVGDAVAADLTSG